jgi:hypothetical protein
VSTEPGESGDAVASLEPPPQPQVTYKAPPKPLKIRVPSKAGLLRGAQGADGSPPESRQMLTATPGLKIIRVPSND